MSAKVIYFMPTFAEFFFEFGQDMFDGVYFFFCLVEGFDFVVMFGIINETFGAGKN